MTTSVYELFPTAHLSRLQLYWAYLIALPLNIINGLFVLFLLSFKNTQAYTGNNIEVHCNNWFAKYMWEKGWGGFSLGSFRYYWTERASLDPYITVHEKYHTMLFYQEPIRYLLRYILNMTKGYTCNAIEQACYKYAKEQIKMYEMNGIKVF
jgi:hypothetical protein